MPYKEKAFISFVVYLYNESDIIEDFLKKINPVIESKFEHFEYILVDDFSTDDTYTKSIEAVEKLNIKASIIRMSRKHQKELALFAGADKAVGDYIYEFETPIIDYPLTLIHDMFDNLKTGHDIITLEPIKKSFSSKCFYYLFNRFSYTDYDIYTERIRLTTRRVLNSTLNINERIRSKKALASLAGFSKISITYKPINNDYKDTRKFYEKLQIAIEFLISYSNLGTRIPIFISIAFILFSAWMSIFALCTWFSMSGIARGWTSTIIFISICFAGVFFILGILSEYITKILKETINIPLYTIQRQHSTYEFDSM